MLNKLPACLIFVALMLPAHFAHAQSSSPQLGPFQDIPLSDQAYSDALTLKKDRFPVSNNWLLDPYSSIYSDKGNRESTAYEFATCIWRFLGDKVNEPIYDAKLRQDPVALAAFDRLVDRFAPYIAQMGVDVPTARARLRGLERPFADVPPTHWAYKSVEALRVAGIIVGYPAHSFQTGH